MPHLFPSLIRLAINGFGWVGAIFIAYGIAVLATGEPWPPLERWATLISSALAIFGTMATTLSIYFFSPNPTPPERMSFIVAPFVIVACIAALAALFWWGAADRYRKRICDSGIGWGFAANAAQSIPFNER